MTRFKKPLKLSYNLLWPPTGSDNAFHSCSTLQQQLPKVHSSHEELRNTVSASGASTIVTHHCLQGGDLQGRGGLTAQIQQLDTACRQHQTGNVALISDWEGCWLWEWMFHGCITDLPAPLAWFFIFNRNHRSFSQRKEHALWMKLLVPQLLRDSDQSLHWPKTDLSEQVTRWGNIVFSFPINPGHRNAHCRQSANQEDTLSFKTIFNFKNLCCHGEKFSGKGKGWVKHLLL